MKGIDIDCLVVRRKSSLDLVQQNIVEIAIHIIMCSIR